MTQIQVTLDDKVPVQNQIGTSANSEEKPWKHVCCSRYLPQRYKDPEPDQLAQSKVDSDRLSLGKMEKAVQIGDALAEAVDKLDCGEEQREEIARKLESVQKDLVTIQAQLNAVGTQKVTSLSASVAVME